MPNYEELEITEKAIGFVRQHLSYGLSLSRYILHEINLLSGVITTALPKGAKFEKVYDFERGGIMLPPPESERVRAIGKDGKEYSMIPIPIYTTYVVEKIKTYLTNKNNRLCIFENANVRASDPALHLFKSNIWLFQNEVYHILTGGQHSIEEIESTILDSQSGWTSVGFMTSLPENMLNTLENDSKGELLLILAKRVEKIIVSAYDNEGFLMWHRQGTIIPTAI